MTTLPGNAPPAYAPPRHAAPIDLPLAGNEGPAPAAALLDALRAHGTEILRRYPDRAALERTLAARLGLAAEHVLVTAGADEGLDRLFRAVLGPGRKLVLPEPTFEMLPRYARLCGARIVSVLWPDGPYPLDAVRAACDPQTAVVALVSPNNPTGAIASADSLRRLAASVPHAVVLVDAAYAEYADADLTDVALALPNAIVFRTLSKAWGLAGLRVGYAAAGRRELIDALRAAGSPFSVAGPSLAIAAAALEFGEGALRAHVARVREEREVLVDDLRALGVRAAPSQGNFVLARCADPLWLRDGLAGLGIGVRVFDGALLRDAVRITCPGAPEPFARLRHALAATLAPQALLLDMDGVLADVSGSYRAAIEATAASFGVRIGPGDVRRAKAAGDANDDWRVTWRLVRDGGKDVAYDDVRARFEELYQGSAQQPGLHRNETLLIPPAMLERLAGRLPLGIVTGRPRADAQRFLAQHGIGELFGAVVCREDAPLKPDPAPVRRALAQLGCERGWLVGDTPDDIRAARAAGVVPIASRAPGDESEGAAAALSRAGAARVLARIEELEALLR
jgi:histidinol-phosphate aminotransferase